MRANITIEANSEDKVRLLIRIAEEMGLEVTSHSLADENTLVSEPSLAEDWNSPEDERWDVAYAHLKK
jgi:hypothetical protein